MPGQFARAEKLDLNDSEYLEALEAAAHALNPRYADESRGADHFHHIDISPSWAKGQPTTTLWHHRFYRLEI